MATETTPATPIDYVAEFDGIVAYNDMTDTNVTAEAFDSQYFANDELLKPIGSTALDSIGITPVRADHVLSALEAELLADNEYSTTAAVFEQAVTGPVTETATETSVERTKPVSKGLKRKVGTTALSPVRAFHSINAHANAAFINVMAKTPGFKSKDELLEDQRLKKEKYTIHDDDGFLTRQRKRIGRNGVKAAAWTMPALMGLAGASALLRPIAETIPFETLPFEHLVMATDIQVGGHTQGNALESGYVQSLQNAGLYDSNNKNVPINWSAQMSPISGDTMPMNISDAEGAQKIVDAVNDAGPAPIRILAFSQGTEATARALNTIADQNGGRVPDNITVILQGTPSGDLGIGKNPLVHTANPILGAMGIETSVPIPPGAHVIVRTDIADVFGNGGNQSAAMLGLQAIGPGHRVVGPENAVLISTYDKDGVTYEVWGDKDGINNPLTRALRDQGVPITPQAEALMEAAVPFTPHDAAGPVYANSDDVGHKIGPAIDSYTGNTGMATRATEAILNDPNTSQDFKNALGVMPIPDQINDAIQHPENAPQDIQAVMSEGTAALNSGVKYLNNPNLITQDVNTGLGANGLPPLMPNLAQPAAPAYVPDMSTLPPAPRDIVPPAATSAPSGSQSDLGGTTAIVNSPALVG